MNRDYLPTEHELTGLTACCWCWAKLFIKILTTNRNQNSLCIGGRNWTGLYICQSVELS